MGRVKKMSLSAKVLTGLGLGVVTEVYIGGNAGVLPRPDDAFIPLIQMPVPGWVE